MSDCKLLTASEAAEFLKVKPSTMYYWRSRGIGPEYAKIARKVVYSLSDLMKFHETKKHKEAQA